MLHVKHRTMPIGQRVPNVSRETYPGLCPPGHPPLYGPMNDRVLPPLDLESPDAPVPDDDGFGPADIVDLLDVSRETLSTLSQFRALLAKWSRQIDLVGPRELSRFWRRHALDSLQILRLAPPEALSFADLGSGAGFPGLVLAMQLRERAGAHAVLHESDGRKAAFLRQMIVTLALPARVEQGRIENAPEIEAEVVSARALAPLPVLLEYANRVMRRKNGCGLFLKGQDVAAELTTAANSWNFAAQRIPSLADPEGVVLRVEALSRVPCQ